MEFSPPKGLEKTLHVVARS